MSHFKTQPRKLKNMTGMIALATLLVFFGSKLWNSLPTEIRQASSMEKFKKHSFNYFMGIIKSVNYTQYEWTF